MDCDKKLNFFMNEALNQAKLAYDDNEVPIGAVVVYNNEIIGRGRNMRMKMRNPLYHAEIIAINEASKYMNDWRLENCHMFVTVEPCPMCAGAILQSRIKSLTFGCENKKSGAVSSVINILQNSEFNHTVNITKNIMEEQCRKIMQDFFRKLR